MIGKEEVVAIRERHRLTRREFAQLLRVPYETLCRWENGSRAPSKVYEERLRSLAAQTVPPTERQPEQWIFTASNLTYVKHNIILQQHRAFGIIYALWDDPRSVFVASIRLRRDVHQLEELGQYIPISGSKKQGPIGIFIACDLPYRPSDHTVSFMNKYHERGASQCAIYEQVPDVITLWKFDPLRRSELDRVFQIHYSVVG